MSLITANTAGSTKRTTVNAIFFISYCVGNIIGPFAFISSEAPVYKSGIIAILVANCVEVGILLGFAAYLAFCNTKKEKNLIASGKTNASEDERSVMAFKDLTDVENPFFVYSY